MSSGRLRSVVRPAQYTDSRVDMPTAPSASANSTVVPTGTSRPAPRSTRAKPTASRSTSGSGTALRRRSFRRGAHELLDPRRPSALLVFAVLQDGAERDLDRALIDRRASERGQRVGPVDGLGDARRLVELELSHPLDRRRDLAR